MTTELWDFSPDPPDELQHDARAPEPVDLCARHHHGGIQHRLVFFLVI